MKRLVFNLVMLLGGATVLTCCGLSFEGNSTSSSNSEQDNQELEEGIPDMFANFSGSVQIYLDGDEVILETQDIPNHPSPYFDESHELYEEPHSGMVVNPNRIDEQDFVFRVPVEPSDASSPGETNLGAIGIAVNGVVLFNQYAGRTNTGDWLPLDDEIATFDLYNGHPQGQGAYHYHFEPVYLTADDLTVLVGVMLDGYPIYGPEDIDGSTPNDLDECNGHFGITPDHGEGIYHYHTTAVEPYMIGCFTGETGTVSN